MYSAIKLGEINTAHRLSHRLREHIQNLNICDAFFMLIAAINNMHVGCWVIITAAAAGGAGAGGWGCVKMRGTCSTVGQSGGRQEEIRLSHPQVTAAADSGV